MTKLHFSLLDKQPLTAALLAPVLRRLSPRLRLRHVQQQQRQLRLGHSGPHWCRSSLASLLQALQPLWDTLHLDLAVQKSARRRLWRPLHQKHTMRLQLLREESPCRRVQPLIANLLRYMRSALVRRGLRLSAPGLAMPVTAQLERLHQQRQVRLPTVQQLLQQRRKAAAVVWLAMVHRMTTVIVIELAALCATGLLHEAIGREILLVELAVSDATLEI